MDKKFIPPTIKNNEIENLRAQLIESGVNRGLLHPDTIKLSKQLDVILNRFRNTSNLFIK